MGWCNGLIWSRGAAGLLLELDQEPELIWRIEWWSRWMVSMLYARGRLFVYAGPLISDTSIATKPRWGRKFQTGRRSVGRPARWSGETDFRWMRMAWERGLWRNMRQTYVQQWTCVGCWWWWHWNLACINKTITVHACSITVHAFSILLRWI